MKRIAIYPRKSVFRDNSESVSVQVKLCKEYSRILFPTEEIQYSVYDRDEGFSGKNTNRPSYQEMMRDVRNDMLDAVMVYKLDRISRNVREFSEMFGVLQEHNVAFISVKESFDTSTPIGRTVMFILAAFAQLERENTSERVADNMQALGSSGYWTGGTLPVGMVSERRIVNGREHSYLQLDPSSVWKVRTLGELMLNGYSITKIERYCRDHDIRTAKNCFLGSSQIHNILRNPVYCQNSKEAYYHFKSMGCTVPDNPELFDGTKGLIAYGRTTTTSSGLRSCTPDSWSIACGIHDYVFPFEEWKAIQNRLGTNKQDRSNKYQVGILKGVLVCSCGSRMANRVYQKNNIQFAYYYCQKAVRQNTCPIRYYKIKDIDDLFIRKLQEIKLNPQYIQLQKQTDDDFVKPAAIRSSIRSTETAIQNLTTQLQENSSSAAAKYIISQIEELDQKLSTLQMQLHRSELLSANKRNTEEAATGIYQNICTLLDHLDTMEYAEKNELVKKITKKCVLDQDELHIVF